MDTDVSADITVAIELTREEASKMREYYLSLAENNSKFKGDGSDEIDSADSTMATLILPGG